MLLFRRFRQGGAQSVLSEGTMAFVVVVVLFVYGRERFSTVKEERLNAKNRNEVIESIEGDYLGKQSTPLCRVETPSYVKVIPFWIRPSTIRSLLSRIPFSSRLHSDTLNLLLALDICSTYIEVKILGFDSDPATIPKPLRRRWNIEEPDEVEYPLLDRDL